MENISLAVPSTTLQNGNKKFLSDEEFRNLMNEQFYCIKVPIYPSGINFTTDQAAEFKKFLFDLTRKLSDLEYDMGRLIDYRI